MHVLPPTLGAPSSVQVGLVAPIWWFSAFPFPSISSPWVVAMLIVAAVHWSFRSAHAVSDQRHLHCMRDFMSLFRPLAIDFIAKQTEPMAKYLTCKLTPLTQAGELLRDVGQPLLTSHILPKPPSRAQRCINLVERINGKAHSPNYMCIVYIYINHSSQMTHFTPHSQHSCNTMSYAFAITLHFVQ